MRKPLALFAACVSLGLSCSAAAQDARSILQEMQQKRAEQWRDIENYLVDQATMGHRSLLYFERVEEAEAGSFAEFRLVLPDELAERQSEARGGPKLSAEDYRRMAEASRMTGDALDSEMDRELAAAGLPPGILSAGSANRFATLDPGVVMGNAGDFYDAAADAKEEMDRRDPGADARRDAMDMEEFANRAQFAGRQQVDGRDAYMVRADNINRTERTEDGQEFTINTATWWIDTERYVPLRLKMEGTATSEGETRPMVIEKLEQDYRRVGPVYMPFRQVMRIGGALTPEQEAEMKQAQQQLEDFDRQMAEMPESQRAMMERMVGPQMETLRSLASSGALEVVTDVHQVRLNAGMPDEISMGATMMSPPAASSAAPPASAPPAGPPPAASPGAAAPSTAGAAAPTSAAAGTGSPPDAAALQAARQACLEQKMEEARAAQKKKRGFGRLMSAAGRVMGRGGNNEIGNAIGDVYSANATAEDLAAAARDLGLTEDDIAACENP